MKTIHDYRAVIFDVDGTLYYQNRLRTLMAGLLLGHVILHPSRFIDLKIIKEFRKFREEITEIQGELSVYQYQVVADHLSVNVARVKTVVEKWIYRVPLPYLRSCRDEQLAAMARQLKSRGVTTIAYSDYPAADKLAALGVEMDHVFSATDPGINCLKPNPAGLNAILNQLSLSARDCLFIGDRDEKDGRCARQVGMDYIVLPTSRSKRRRLYSRPPFVR